MFPSNQRGKVTKEEKKLNCFILFFHWSLVSQKQFMSSLIGEEFEFNIFKDIV